jgi:hypothetical protein
MASLLDQLRTLSSVDCDTLDAEGKLSLRWKTRHIPYGN